MVSDQVWTAIVTAAPPTVVALVGGILGYLNHLQGAKIHVLVNSNMTAVKTDLALANDRIEKLQLLVAQLSSPKVPVAVTVPVDLMLPVPLTIPKAP